MKRYLIFVAFIVVCVSGAWFVVANKSTLDNSAKWINYTHKANPSLSFSYPKMWGQPRVVDHNDKDGRKFQVDFGNYRFSVNNGYYFLDVDGKRPSVAEMLQGYEKDKEKKNEVKDFTTKEIRIDHSPAVRVDVNSLNGSHYIDIYVYNRDQNTSDFILITTDKSFVNESTFNSILASFKLTMAGTDATK